MDNGMIIELKQFINFNLERLQPDPYQVNDQLVRFAFEKTVADFRYHFMEMLEDEIKKNILRNQGGLSVFLYRLVREMAQQGFKDDVKYQIHSLMKVLCGCEIYWSTEIDVGLYVDHGVGMIIGSRCQIGKGFRIYQGCTVGHGKHQFPQVKPKSFIPEEIKKRGPRIGSDVVMFANSLILGDIMIGDNVVIAANSLVIDSFESDLLVVGSPARPLNRKGI